MQRRYECIAFMIYKILIRENDKILEKHKYVILFEKTIFESAFRQIYRL